MELQPWIRVYMVGNERRSQALELKGRASALTLPPRSVGRLSWRCLGPSEGGHSGRLN